LTFVSALFSRSEINSQYVIFNNISLTLQVMIVRTIAKRHHYNYDSFFFNHDSYTLVLIWLKCKIRSNSLHISDITRNISWYSNERFYQIQSKETHIVLFEKIYAINDKLQFNSFMFSINVIYAQYLLNVTIIGVLYWTSKTYTIHHSYFNHFYITWYYFSRFFWTLFISCWLSRFLLSSLNLFSSRNKEFITDILCCKIYHICYKIYLNKIVTCTFVRFIRTYE